MNYIHRPGWFLPDSAATDETVYANRRQFMTGLAATIGAAGLGLSSSTALATGEDWPMEPASTDSLYPFPRNEKYTVTRPITATDDNWTYNNFYEFGSHKSIAKAAQDLKTRPWTITVDGLVDNPKVWDIDDLIKAMPREERVYRHRCVEAWSMIIPWAGFELSHLIKLAGPSSGAKYVRFEGFNDSDMAPGQRQYWYPWPYVEGLTLPEAMNELTFMVTGTYGRPGPKQHGAPLRLAVPWKYGFKGIKSITKITLTDERPVSFWEELQKAEYGFWANVNPAVDHPRWSQATERVLGGGGRIPSVLYNGYGEYVADLYKGLEDEYGDRLWR